MSNLTNVYAYLRNNYSELDDVNVLYSNKSISYLDTLLSDFNNEKFIFVYKEDKSRKKSTSSVGSLKKTPEKLNEDSKSDSLIGSPLKDDCEIEVIQDSFNAKSFNFPWSEEEEQYAPIPAGLARKISNEVSNEAFPDDPKGMLWILADDESIFAYGSYFEKEFNTRGIIKYKNQMKFCEITMEKLLDMHYSFIRPSAKLETKVETYFDLNSHMRLKFTNESMSKHPSLAVNESSEVILYQQIGILEIEEDLLLGDFWTQIDLLNRIKNIIVELKNSEETPFYNLGSAVEFEKLQQQINKGLKDFGVPVEDENEFLNDHSLEATIKRAKNRPLIDLTDQLWDYLKYAASYNVLKQAFTYIFQVAIRSNIVNIPTNNNRTAELIRDLSQQRLAIPNLTGTEPLELLLEIGIEKLMKDYQFIFTESKICSLNGINFQDQPIDDGVIGRKSLAVSNGPEMARKTLLHSQNNAETSKEIVGIRNSRFDENLVDFKISKLAQIHLLVQHLLMIQNNLNLENDYGSIARKVLARPLASFDALSKLQQDKLELPILCKKANELVENFMPSAKKISLRSETKFKKVENIFYFNVDMILPPCVLNREEVEEDLERNDIYHFFHALKMSTVAF